MNWLITFYKESHLDKRYVLVSAKSVPDAVAALMAKYPEYSIGDKIEISPSAIVNFEPVDE